MAESTTTVRSAARAALSAIPVVLLCLFLVLPLAVILISSFNAGNNFRFPPEDFSFRWYTEIFTSPVWTQSLLFSLLLMVLVVPVVVLLGTLGGYAIGAGRFPGRGALSVLFLSPMTVPGVMLGLALLFQLQSLGLVGSLPGLWLAHVIVAFPFCVRVVAVSAAALDPQLVKAARSLGASPWHAFVTVTIPLLRPGIIAGAFFAAIVSLGEVAVSVFVSGFSSVTVPVRVYSAVQVQFDPSVAAVSSVLLVASIVTIVVLDRFVTISRFI